MVLNQKEIEMNKLLSIAVLATFMSVGAAANDPHTQYCDQHPTSPACSGIPGPVGPAGQDGQDGQDGVDGTNGTNGKDGADGTNGKDGTNGVDGVNGTNGIDGTDGATGSNGTDGNDGTNGTDGSDGSDGSTGATGSTGNSGSDGRDGSNGTNGVDGKNGDKGEDGNDGKDAGSSNVASINSDNIYRNNVRMAGIEDFMNRAHKFEVDSAAGSMAVSSIDFNPDHKGLSMGIGFGVAGSFDRTSTAAGLGIQYGLDNYEQDVAVNMKAWRTSGKSYGVGFGAVVGF